MAGQNGSDTLALSKTEASTLQRLETVVERGIAAFVEVGQALRFIKENRLYRQDYDSFEAYCSGRWQRSRTWAYQIMESAEAAETLNGASNKQPSAREDGQQVSTMVDTSLGSSINERQARALKDVPQEQRTEVWKEAVESAPKGSNGKPKVTAAHVRRVAQEKAETDENPDSEPAADPAEPFTYWNAGTKEIIASMNHTVSLMRRLYGAKGAARSGVEFSDPYAQKLVNALTTISDQERLRRLQEELIVVRQRPDGSFDTIGDIKSRRASA